MNRTISRSEAPVLEQLEMERPELVTMGDLATLLDSAGVRTLPRVFAARLRAKGWLLPTEQRGVWEFAPAALAGPYSSFNPALPLRAFLAKRPGTPCGLTFQAAAWAHGCADRVPARPEVAVADALTAHKLPPGLRAFSFTPALSPNRSRGVPVLMPESVLTHMCTKPVAVRSWNSALDWLPELAAEANIANIEAELSSRPRTVARRPSPARRPSSGWWTDR